MRARSIHLPLAVIALWALPMAAGCDDAEPGETLTVSGKENGTRCILSGTGADICRGRICQTPFAESTSSLGVCSEPCDKRCQHGGQCVRQPGLQGICAQPCADGRDCDPDASCQPFPTFIEVCTEEGCLPAPDELFCLPVFY